MNRAGDFDRSSYFVQEDKTYQNKEKDKHTKQMILANTTYDIPFNKNDPNQSFFRESSSLELKKEILTRIGWKVINLERQEEDLTMECCSLLESKLIIPVNFFTNFIQLSENNESFQPPIKSLWMVTSIHRQYESREINSFRKETQFTKIFDYYESKLLPLLVYFLKSNISWEKLIKNNRKTILTNFEENVIMKANEWIKILNK